MKAVRHFGIPALIAALGLAYFGLLVARPSQTLYSDHSDLIALHVPWETFFARSWQETGEMPLWNPLQFAGLPFAHDIQAATAYPPHWIFGRIAPANVGAALSWLLVLHVILAGWGTYAYARMDGLGRAASLVAAIGFMFAGKWLLHLILAGHYAFIGLAWLPWAALGMVQAVRGRGLIAAAWGGAALGLMAVSTHPQITLYASLFLAAWTLAAAPPSVPSNRRETSAGLRPWIACGIVAASVSIGVGAIQILPSLEMVPMTTRGLSGAGQGASGSIRSLLQLLGPSPSGVDLVTSWEPRSGFGVVWIAVALLATIVTVGPVRVRARRESLVTIGLVVFALGGSFLLQGLPGFRLFRQPNRMFLIAAFPLSLLAATAVQGLLDGPSPEARATSRKVAARAFVVLLVILGISVATAGASRIRPQLYWFTLAATVPSAWVLIGKRGSMTHRTELAWVLILLADVASLSWPHVRTRPLDRVLAPSPCARFVADHAGPLDRVLDRNSPGHPSNTPLGPAVATDLGLSQVRGYNPLDLARFKDYLRIMADPVVVPRATNGVANFPILHPAMLDLLGVRFLVQPADPALRPVGSVPSALSGWTKVFDDPGPSAFTFARGGIQTLPAYEVLENRSPLPREFVVPVVAELPRDRIGLVEAMTRTDFRVVALVEVPMSIASASSTESKPPAAIRDYRANRIEIEADGPGLLVVADPWFPGWTAEVDGRATEVIRADYLFRGIPLATGHHRVTMAFRPVSVMAGRAISVAACVFLVLATALVGWRRWIARGLNPMVETQRSRARLRASVVRSSSMR